MSREEDGRSSPPPTHPVALPAGSSEDASFTAGSQPGPDVLSVIARSIHCSNQPKRLCSEHPALAPLDPKLGCSRLVVFSPGTRHLNPKPAQRGDSKRWKRPSLGKGHDLGTSRGPPPAPTSSQRTLARRLDAWRTNGRKAVSGQRVDAGH